jgi:HAE1 family hydrophobic/amphiphilic exporter-1/multidrug efflux pump
MLRFFIDRPIFSSVISIIIVLAGTAALMTLPVEQYPNVAPPQIIVEASYSSASAEVLARAVAAPLEQAINGVENMIFMETTASDRPPFPDCLNKCATWELKSRRVPAIC